MSDQNNPLGVINNSGHKLNYDFYYFFGTEKKFYKITLQNQWTGQIYPIEVSWPWEKIEVKHAIVEGDRLSIDILFESIINQWKKEHENKLRKNLLNDLKKESKAQTKNDDEERRLQRQEQIREEKKQEIQQLNRRKTIQKKLKEEEKLQAQDSEQEQIIESNISQVNERQQKREEERKQEQEQRLKKLHDASQKINKELQEEMEQEIEINQQNFRMEMKNIIKNKFTQLKDINFEECEDSLNGEILIKTRSNPNSCYMNSVIQCLSNTFPLYQYFINFKLFQLDLPFENNEHPSIIVEFISLINQLWNKNQQQIDKNQLAKYVCEKNKQFGPGVQNDAQQFLIFLLNEFREQLNRIKNNQQQIENLDEKLKFISQQQQINAKSQAYIYKNQSVIDDLFMIDSILNAQCYQCNKRNLSLEKNLTLNLQVPQNQQNVTLEQCIENTFNLNNYNEQSLYSCNICDPKKKEINQQHKLYRLGPLLIICLQRFQEGQKNNCLVEFPIKNLKMNKFVHRLKDQINQANEEQYTYDLYATINHEYQKGIKSKGNYFSICYNFKLNSWIKFNDMSESPKTLPNDKLKSQVVNQSAYILFYKQKNFNPQEKNFVYAIQMQSLNQYDEIIKDDIQDFRLQDEAQQQYHDQNQNLIDQISEDEKEEEFEIIEDDKQFIKKQIPQNIEFDQEEYIYLIIQRIENQIKIIKNQDGAYVYPEGLRVNGFRQQQIMAIKTIFYSSQQNILLQVKPGEGKTIIIAAACILIICKNKAENIDQNIDIMTSSEYLARENYKENQQLFEAFYISSSCAVQNENEDVPQMKNIYSNQIVYSTTFKAQSDYIRHQYMNDGRRGQREISESIIIVDEVDNMFLDKCTQTCILSKPAPGFGYLNEILVIIFQLTSKYIEINDRWFMQMTFKELQEEDIDISKDIQNIISQNQFDQQILITNQIKNQLIKSIKYQEVSLAVQQNDFKWQEFTPKNISFLDCKYCIAVYNNYEVKILKLLNRHEQVEFLKNHLETSIDGFQFEEEEEEQKQNIIENNLQRHFGKKENNYYVPQLYLPYIKQNIDKLIQNAVRARSLFNKDKDYVIDIRDNEAYLYIVDFQNTGEVQMNTQWSDGLHQFICLKEKIPLQDLNISYIHQSSFSFYKCYLNIIGLSGTLGDEIDRSSLKDNYDLILVDIPPHISSKFKQQKSLVFIYEDEWKNTLIQMIYEISQDRAVLVICESICNSEYLNEQFELLQDNKDENERRITKKFNRGDDEKQQKTVEEKVDKGNVIFATNVGARGADFKISQELNENGGMHVIITFLPQNKRVQDQAFLRTARAGNEGTGQLVYVSPIQNLSNQQNIQHRNMNSINQLDENKQQLNILQNQDQIFERFIQNKKQLDIENEDKKKFLIIDKQVTYGIRQIQNIQDGQYDLLNEIFDVNIDKFLNPFIQIQYANKLLKKYLKEQNNDEEIAQNYQLITENQKQEFVYFPAFINYGIFLLTKFQQQQKLWNNYDRDNLLQGADYFEKGLSKMQKVIERGCIIAALIESQQKEYNSQRLKENNSNEQTYKQKSSMSQYFVDKLHILNTIHSEYSQKLKEIKEYIKKKNYFEIQIQPIGNHFENNNNNLKIISELEQFGVIGMIDLQNKNDRNLLTILAIISALQIVAGVVLMCTVAGYYIGDVLLAEGISDAVFLVQSSINQDLAIKTYLVNKSVSMTLSMCGTAAKFASQASKNAQVAAKGASVLRNAGNQIIKQEFIIIEQQSVKVALKKATFEIGKGLVKGSGTLLSKKLSKYVQEYISKELKQNMIEKIDEQIFKSTAVQKNRDEHLFQVCVLYKDQALSHYIEEENQLIEQAFNDRKFWLQATGLCTQIATLVRDHFSQYQNDFNPLNPSQLAVFSLNIMESLQGFYKASKVIETFQYNYNTFSQKLIQNREKKFQKIYQEIDDNIYQIYEQYDKLLVFCENENKLLNKTIQKKIFENFDNLIYNHVINPHINNLAQYCSNFAINQFQNYLLEDFNKIAQDFKLNEVQKQQIKQDIIDAVSKYGIRTVLKLSKNYIQQQYQFKQIKKNDLLRAIKNMNLEVEMIQLNISTKKINKILKYLKQKGYLTSKNVLIGNRLFEDLQNKKINFEDMFENQMEREILIEIFMYATQRLNQIKEQIYSSEFWLQVVGNIAYAGIDAGLASHSNYIDNFYQNKSKFTQLALQQQKLKSITLNKIGLRKLLEESKIEINTEISGLKTIRFHTPRHHNYKQDKQQFRSSSLPIKKILINSVHQKNEFKLRL